MAAAHEAGPADVPVRRPERPEDAPFLRALFAAAQGTPLEGLPAPLRALLLDQGFAGQAATYRALYPQACHEIVEAGGVPVGRLVTARGAALTVVDVALLPPWQGRGLGTRLLGEVMAEAARLGLPVHLTVAQGNAGARRLYARLGFRPIAQTDLTLDLAWSPAP
ncbi:GCN5-related N-acetyltransferase [Methylobacterium sp. 4-46]|uniref:GNAT family N-acetyltransferase n=1 Tax=unclassified Methylobacterium TaxID=2615210 RepID=UPI000152CEB7|nr:MULTISPECIES: GNAT family N-acetyltransferase [Methylobacterium]ACA17876.1 GCN5-related N-acetyltransferase [Methylobacterium sp. 4-46]WFT77177.1 GNAT family N-acetyltransferase [Methylobacterium nodulans]